MMKHLNDATIDITFPSIILLLALGIVVGDYFHKDTIPRWLYAAADGILWVVALTILAIIAVAAVIFGGLILKHRIHMWRLKRQD